jgi:prepilin signal peptidase PulO-like enzyme (type II secretory pathway)
MALILICLFILGLCFGSFVNALVWRIHEQAKTKNSKLKTKNLSILHGRSMCPDCRHTLAAKDLVPLFSWLQLRGKCRYCKKPISAQYPLVELAGGLIFVLSYIYWPQPLHSGQWVLLTTWLAASVGLLALLVYDLKWMLLPNRIVYPTFFVAFVGQLVYLIGFEDNKLHAALNWALSVLVASGLFWLLFTVSKGRWIGYGDVRLGLITGTLLQTPTKSALMIFVASTLGTAAILPLLAGGRAKLSAKIPYGPFLITATFICLLFGDSLINWYQNLFQ